MSDPAAELAALGRDLPADVKTRLRAVHDALAFGCAARDEGQTCCVDIILGGGDG